MNKSQIASSVVQELFESASNAADKGQAQWFTPPAWASLLALPLPDYRPVICDLTCGNGALLTGVKKKSSVLLGCDIEPQDGYVGADITKFYPLLRAVKWECNLFTLNPPWDLHWYRENLALLAESECSTVAEAFTAHDGRTSKDTIDSTVATLMIAIDRSAYYGEGYLIGNESTLQREIFAPDAPHGALAQHIWAHITADIFENGGRQGIIYFTRQMPQPKCFEAHCRDLGAAEKVLTQLKQDRLLWRKGPEAGNYGERDEAPQLWNAAAEEWRRLNPGGKPLYNIWLDNYFGTPLIRTSLSLFDTATKRVDNLTAARLFELNRKQPIQLVVQRTQRRALEEAVTGNTYRVDPKLVAAVRDAIGQYNAVRSPLYPLPKIQRLGYLDEQDEIKCTASLGYRDAKGAPQFRKGKKYPIRSITVAVKRQAQKMNLQGFNDDVEYNGQELAFFIKDESGAERCFMEARLRDPKVEVNLMRSGRNGKNVLDEEKKCPIDFTLQEMIQCFDIPEVPDVATMRPEEYKRNLAALDDIVAIVNAILPNGEKFKCKIFQREDYARGAMHDGIILGHDTGLGKTIASILWSLLKAGYTRTASGVVPNRPVLLVVPGDGHEQTADEIWKHFRIRLVTLDSQETFRKLSRPDARTGRRELPNGFYITSYTQLSGNGVQDFPPYEGNPEGMMRFMHLGERDAVEWFENRQQIYSRYYDRLEATHAMTWKQIEKQYQDFMRAAAGNTPRKDLLTEAWFKLQQMTPRAGKTYSSLDEQQQLFIKTELAIRRQKEFSAGIGSSKTEKIYEPDKERTEENVIGSLKLKCIYSASLADLCQDCFGVIVVDEGTKMKGEATAISLGIRQINAPYRIVMTATPIKNRFPDVFRLAHYVCGGHEEPTARFPYGDDSRDTFAQEFLVSERNLTKEEKSDTPRRFLKLTPQVCNIHLAWKLFAPIILRRRKADCGEEIVKKNRHVVRVPLGLYQAAVYQFHLKAKYRDCNNQKAVGAQLQALRMAAANPASESLKRPERDDTGGLIRSKYSYIPKVATAMSIITQCLERGEQAIVFSAFQDSLDALSARLNEAGVKHLVLDGRISQKKRGQLAKLFKSGPPRALREGLTQRASDYPVMLAGIECMAELHSFHLCNNAILMAYSWAWDKFEQGINRIHRLISPWDVNIWSIICDGSIDRKLESNIHEKGDAAGLVLDGALPGEYTAEVNLAELLHIARNEFKNAKTMDELDLAKDWPKVRAAAGKAYLKWVGRMSIFTSTNEKAKMDKPMRKIKPSSVADLPLWRRRLTRND